MDIPTCLSQNFVNKQNVRSFDNILKSNLLKNSDSAPFLRHIFGNEIMVSGISNNFLMILSTLKSHLREKSKEDFKSYFSALKRENSLCAINKVDVFACCWTALNEIIPKNFFGGNYNNKIFKKLVQSVVNSMRRQHMILPKLIEKWDFSVSPWNSFEQSKNILSKILSWIIKYILSSMICLNFYVTTCKLDADENKLHFFWKSQWQSFFDRKISDMIFSRTLKRFEPYCLCKKVKRNFNLSERLKLKLLKKDIPKLHLVLKPNNDCRPIVRYKIEQTSKEKYKIKERLTFLKSLTGKPHKKLETQYNAIYQQWLSLKRPKLYFVKTDLSNAFGLINKEKLMKILNEKHLNLQQIEKSHYIKKKIAHQYKDMVTELRKPLLVRAGNTVYEWTEGLVQGYKYSPALSELYYGYLDDKYFSQHLKTSDCQIRFFIRVVDDYLYITDSLEDAHSFLIALSSYRNVNYEKTVVNFPHERIRSSKEITFLGYSYNTNNMQVSRASNMYVGQMCYKIAFTSSLVNMNKFLDNRIGQSGIQTNSHIFNLNHNNEEIIWQHIFTTFCLSANKLCTILAVSELSTLTTKGEMHNYLLLYKKRVSARLSNSMIETLIKNKPADFIFMYCINHFRYLSFQALYLCATQTSKCSGLVPLIKDQLAKSNCIYGKWKNHACRIEVNGEMRRQAIREVCQRPDLRQVFKTFGTLPKGFQCYNQRKLE